jgi:hypothetical protein
MAAAPSVAVFYFAKLRVVSGFRAQKSQQWSTNEKASRNCKKKCDQNPQIKETGFSGMLLIHRLKCTTKKMRYRDRLCADHAAVSQVRRRLFIMSDITPYSAQIRSCLALSSLVKKDLTLSRS